MPDTFDFTAIPSVNKTLVMELARCEYIERRENVIAVGNSGTGKTHVALRLVLISWQRSQVSLSMMARGRRSSSRGPGRRP